MDVTVGSASGLRVLVVSLIRLILVLNLLRKMTGG